MNLDNSYVYIARKIIFEIGVNIPINLIDKVKKSESA